MLSLIKLKLREPLDGSFHDPDLHFRWCFGGGGVSVPEPTEEERELQRAQVEVAREELALARKSAKQQDAFAQLLFESSGFDVIRNSAGDIVDIRQTPETLRRQQLQETTQNLALRASLEAGGFEPVFDEEGRIVDFREAPEVADEPSEPSEVERLLNERTIAALKGELPVSPALEAELARGREIRTEQLRRQLGPGFETSSPGIEGLARIDETENLLLEEARRGNISTLTGLGLQAGQLGLGRQQQTLANLFAGAQAGSFEPALQNALTATQFPLQTVSALNAPLSAFGSIAGNLQQNRFAQAQAQAAAAQAQAQTLGGLFGALGTLGGFGILKSDRRLKTDIKRVGVTDKGIPVYVFRFKDDPARQLHMGVLADEVEAKYPEMVETGPDGFKRVDYGML